MKVYEIINPSDPYTLKTDNFLAAAVIVYLVGRGQYGLGSKDGDERTPILFGWDQWLESYGLKTQDDLVDFVNANRLEMAEALDSVMIGGFADREETEETLAALPKGKRAAWLAKRHGRRRTSMNDIDKVAKSVAKQLRAKAQPAGAS